MAINNKVFTVHVLISSIMINFAFGGIMAERKKLHLQWVSFIKYLQRQILKEYKINDMNHTNKQ